MPVIQRRPLPTVLVLAVAAMGMAVTACTSGHPDADRRPASLCNAIDKTHTARPSSTPRPVAITGFDDYTAVRLCDYPGPHHYGYASLRFKVFDTVHCDLYDGPASFQYYSSIKCWGPQLPGAPDGSTEVELSPGSVPTFGHADVTNLEQQDDGHFHNVSYDPANYRTLEAGHKLIVPGSRNGKTDLNDEVCAATHDNTLICEIQHPEYPDHQTHGFRLSPRGSQLY